MKCCMTGQEKSDLLYRLIEVTAWTGLIVFTKLCLEAPLCAVQEVHDIFYYYH